tara:strand:- start:44 stop:394 length:351 start_codon:yes stop_codon:yes gene_type:complete
MVLTPLLQGASGSFFKWHVACAVSFALLYKLSDEFISRFPVISEDIGLGETRPPADSMLYWLWFSLVTQTTVGYGGAQTSQGLGIPFMKMKNHVYKTLNIMQLISIFAITAYLWRH